MTDKPKKPHEDTIMRKAVNPRDISKAILEKKTTTPAPQSAKPADNDK